MYRFLTKVRVCANRSSTYIAIPNTAKCHSIAAGSSKKINQPVFPNPLTQREAWARTNARSVHVVLDFSLVTFFASRQRKWQTPQKGNLKLVSNCIYAARNVHGFLKCASFMNTKMDNKKEVNIFLCSQPPIPVAFLCIKAKKVTNAAEKRFYFCLPMPIVHLHK